MTSVSTSKGRSQEPGSTGGRFAEEAPARVHLPLGLIYVGAVLHLDLYDDFGRIVQRSGTEIRDIARVRELIDMRPKVRSTLLEDLRRSRWGRENVQRFTDRVPSSDDLKRSTFGQVTRSADPAAKGVLDLIRRTRNNVVDRIFALDQTLKALFAEPRSIDFVPKFHVLVEELMRMMESDSDRALMVQFFEAARDYRGYSTRHSILVACIVAEMCETPELAEYQRPAVEAALLMNATMTEVQNGMAASGSALTNEMRRAIEMHAPDGANLIRSMGMASDLVAEAVAFHHDQSYEDSPLEWLSPSLKIAQFIRVADRYAARLSTRRGRPDISSGMAIKAVVKDAQLFDPAAAHMMRAIGMYPPGTLVMLNTGEKAVVLARGRSVRCPYVAVVMDANGRLIANPTFRVLDEVRNSVKFSLSAEEARVRPHLPALVEIRVPSFKTGAAQEAESTGP